MTTFFHSYSNNTLNFTADCDKFKMMLQSLFHRYCIPDIRLVLKCYRSFYEGGIDAAIKIAMQGDEAEAYVALSKLHTFMAQIN